LGRFTSAEAAADSQPGRTAGLDTHPVEPVFVEVPPDRLDGLVKQLAGDRQGRGEIELEVDDAVVASGTEHVRQALTQFQTRDFDLLVTPSPDSRLAYAQRGGARSEPDRESVANGNEMTASSTPAVDAGRGEVREGKTESASNDLKDQIAPAPSEAAARSTTMPTSHSADALVRLGINFRAAPPAGAATSPSSTTRPATSPSAEPQTPASQPMRIWRRRAL
jgi:hypothetical protein